MSIASQIEDYADGLTAAYDMVAQRGGTMPARKNMENLDTAIATIPSGGSNIGIPREVTEQGVYSLPQSNFTFTLPSSATSVAYGALSRGFFQNSKIVGFDGSSLTSLTAGNSMTECCSQCSALTSVDLSSLETISGSIALYNGFYQCNNLSNLDLSSLKTVSASWGLKNCFYQCTSLTSLDLSSLETISGDSCMYECFRKCSQLASVDLSNLTTISSSGGMQQCLAETALTSVSFDSLEVLTGSQCLAGCFVRCYSLNSVSFPALTSSSFGNETDQFNYMLNGCSGVTVHFPASIQATIGSWSSVTGGFMGTNTTVLFDL